MKKNLKRALNKLDQNRKKKRLEQEKPIIKNRQLRKRA